MKYMGSKARIAKDILPIILQNRTKDSLYIEPFSGGMNTICEVDGPRIANDVNPYLIAMWSKLIEGWEPQYIDKELYIKIKDNPESYPKYLVGWVGFNCSYSGKFFGGYAGQIKTKINTIRDYQIEAIKNVKKQINKLKSVTFLNCSYLDLPKFPNGSVIYCDPPYFGTTRYDNAINHEEFWNWCREQRLNKNYIYVSEYSAPNDFLEIWSKTVSSSLSANGKSGGNKNSTEKLFTLQ
jgi:DNA adenine methylase